MLRKGRRWGSTTVLKNKSLWWLVQQKGPILWIDTINGNIDRYMERYFMPTLKLIPQQYWKWNQQKRELKLFGQIMDFRSADRPENIEGFGYRYILINEAGIVLKDKALYYNTLLPMLLDYPDSKLIAAGTPKGKTYKGDEHLFFTLTNRAQTDDSYIAVQHSSYDNKSLDQDQIAELERQFDPVIAQQELYAEFIELTGLLALYCFDEEWRDDEGIGIVTPVKFNSDKSVYLSFDFNINPFVCLLSHQWTLSGKRYKHYFDEIYLTQDQQSTKKTYPETMCDIIRAKYGPATDYWITGDATSNKGEITEKLKRNAWTQIVKYLDVNINKLKLPGSNPSVGKSLELCNAMLSKPDLVEFRFDPKCKQLLKDFRSVKLTEDGTIDKKDGRRTHLLDAFRYDCNTWDRNFIRNIRI